VICSGLRTIFVTFASGIELPLIKDYGLVKTGVGLAVICWCATVYYSWDLCLAASVLTQNLTRVMMMSIRYGERLRGWKDVGYTLRSG